MKPTIEEVKRFKKKVSFGDSCWIYHGAVNNLGYGQFWWRGKMIGAHRFSMIATNGFIDKWVLHHCDNKPCVRPSHLYWGNHSDNTKDAVERDRMATFDKHGMSELSFDDCYLISLQLEDGFAGRKLAKWWNVHNTTIFKAAKRVTALIKELEK